jgi:hypothetical protein
VIGTLLAACSLSTDDRPRDILTGERPTLVNTTAAAAPQAGTGSHVYFLGPSEAQTAPLIATDRPPRNSPTALLGTLLEGPTAAEQSRLGLRTAIPAGTSLLASTLDAQGTLTVDLSAEFLSNAGDVLLDAVGQVVVTASRSPGVRRVRLVIEGEPQDWPTSSGTTTRDPLSIYDFIDRVVDTMTTTTVPTPSISTPTSKSATTRP